jgi:hypothetical protein
MHGCVAISREIRFRRQNPYSNLDTNARSQTACDGRCLSERYENVRLYQHVGHPHVVGGCMRSSNASVHSGPHTGRRDATGRADAGNTGRRFWFTVERGRRFLAHGKIPEIYFWLE